MHVCAACSQDVLHSASVLTTERNLEEFQVLMMHLCVCVWGDRWMERGTDGWIDGESDCMCVWDLDEKSRDAASH